MVDKHLPGDVFQTEEGLVAYINKGVYLSEYGERVEAPKDTSPIARMAGKSVYETIKNPSRISELIRRAVDTEPVRIIEIGGIDVIVEGNIYSPDMEGIVARGGHSYDKLVADNIATYANNKAMKELSDRRAAAQDRWRNSLGA